jgi:hypothetical protein
LDDWYKISAQIDEDCAPIGVASGNGKNSTLSGWAGAQ